MPAEFNRVQFTFLRRPLGQHIRVSSGSKHQLRAVMGRRHEGGAPGRGAEEDARIGYPGGRSARQSWTLV
jgi:hypothetical protein